MARSANTQTGDSKGSRKTKFSEDLSLARDESAADNEKVAMQLDEQAAMQIDGKVELKEVKASEVKEIPSPPPLPKGRKTGKRSNPDYVGAYFSIPKELHRQLDRYVMDLADEGIEMDRSQIIARLIEGLTRFSKEVGANRALLTVMDLHRNHKS
jgi:hypothetical protein